jgi:hypothetical protein
MLEELKLYVEEFIEALCLLALREGLKTHDNGKIQILRGFDSHLLYSETL